MLRYGSTFSGIGGLDRGLHRAGLDLAFACEFEPWRRGILGRHWPGLFVSDDVRKVSADHLKENDVDPSIHLLVGGFPCQDLSVAGRRKGFDGERSSLFFEFARAADDLVPAGGFVLIENVPGLFSSNEGRDFAHLLATLAEYGFHDLAWRVLDSRHFGVPQRRRRVFILARRASGGVCGEVLAELSGRSRDTSQGRAARARAAAAAGAGAAPAGGAAHGGARAAGRGGAGAAAGRGRGDRGEGGGAAPGVAAPLTSGGNHASKPGRRLEDDVNLAVGGTADEPAVGVYDSANAMRGTDPGTAPTLKSGGERGPGGTHPEGGPGIAGDTVPVVANTLKGQRGKGGGGIGPEETMVPQTFNWQSGGDVRHDVRENETGTLHKGQTPAVHAPVDEAGSLQASKHGYRNDADSAAGGQYAVTESVALAIRTDRTAATGANVSEGVAPSLDQGTAPAVAFNLRGRAEGAVPEPDDQASLRAASGGSSRSYVVPGEDPTLGQPEAGSLGRMGETGGHRLDLDGHGAYVASREDPTALDTRMGNGPDDNRAQAGHLVTNEQEVTHALTAEGHDASEDGTGRGTPLVAGTLTSGQGPQRLDDAAVGGSHVVAPDEAQAFPSTFSNSNVEKGGQSPTLTVGSGAGIPSPPAVFTKVRNASSAEDDETWGEGDTARTLNEMDGDRTTLAAARSLVRRLTPTECERLQGLPDGWTLPYGPSLADAAAWYEIGGLPPVNAATFNALPDQRRRDSGEMKGAVELRETDRSLTLDTSGRDPSAFNGGMMVVPGQEAKSVHEQGDGEGKVGDVYEKDEVDALSAGGGGKPGQGYPLVRIEAKAVTENDEMVFESDNVGSLTSGGGKPGQGYPLVRTTSGDTANAVTKNYGKQPDSSDRDGGPPNLIYREPRTYSVSGGGGEDADLRAQETEDAETLTTRGAWAYTQGGTLVDQQGDHLDAIEAEVPAQPRDEAGTVRSHMRPGSNSDDVVIGLSGAQTPKASEGVAPTLTVPSRSGGGHPPSVAFTQNQREELRELDAAGSLSGQGTHQTTYVATTPVAEGTACPFDCLPDGPRYASLGDAVTSPVGQWIGERLVDVLRERGAIAADGTVDLTADL